MSSPKMLGEWRSPSSEQLTNRLTPSAACMQDEALDEFLANQVAKFSW